jgi:Zn-dependent protease
MEQGSFLGKFRRPLITLGSMVIFAGIYALLINFWFAVGLTLVLFIHEMGHVWAAHRKGIPARAPVFIPLLGAIIVVPSLKDRETEAFVGYGGPLLGSIAGILVFGIWAITPGQPRTLLQVSFVAVFLNLFNLLPIRPLDGGRITQIIGDWCKYVGVAALLFFTVLLKTPVILLIVGYFALREWREPQRRPSVPTKTRVMWAMLYVVLAAVLTFILALQIPHHPWTMR